MNDIPTPPAPTPPPIELSCEGCGRLLRVPAEAIGRQVKCPQCGTIQVVSANSSTGEYSTSSRSSAPPAVTPDDSPPSSPDPLPTPPAPSTDAPGIDSNVSHGTTRSGEIALQAGGFHQTAPKGERTRTCELFERIQREIGKIFVGQDELVLGTLVALFSGGHILIESVPGLGKTLLVRTLGRVLGCRFGRIQFTADLMPSDITGAPLLDMKTQEFRFRPGPVFTQLLLADEINRSPAKTHAALLEIMQEYRVTVDGTSHELQRPFLVMATQNPIESEGTYNLPEAQLDRFMFKLVADYPHEQEEREILRLHSRQENLYDRLESDVRTVTSPAEIMEITRKNAEIHVEEALLDYIGRIVRLTRRWPTFHLGASPRAGIALMQGARSLAAFSGRDYVVPDDVVQMAIPALRHRVILTAEAEVEGRNADGLLQELIRSVEVPRS